MAAAGDALLIEKKSKFIANVRPVCDEAAALAFLQEMRSEYSDATHNVYAYVIDENNIFRYSDDGEPGGTAGMPVLDTIRKEGLVDVAVVVTRYFGGTLLGTGGLVHAYGAACRMGLEAAGIVTRILCNLVSVRVDYTMVGKMQYTIASGGYILEDTEYGNEVEFKLCLKNEELEKFTKDVTELTCGRAIIKQTGKRYIDI
ncbi:MAG: YigZ family protein [Clostridia bacterium]|nr:YigZ family protein [Clostridia bacterium]